MFKPKYINTSSDKIKIAENATIDANGDNFITSHAKRIAAKSSTEGDLLCNKINVFTSIPQKIIQKLGEIYQQNKEGYVVVMAEEINVYGESREGAIFGLSALEHMIDTKSLCQGFFYDYPDKPLRGYKLYMPDLSFIDDFKKIVDMLVYYKYNTIMIEVGGAMEYKRRPEINQAWVKFCSQFMGQSDKTHDIQNRTYPWWKNSIHVDNGNGGFISQDTVRELVAYCKERGLEVIPEVPTMSHSDYIVHAYPHLNERVEDKHPDTYCPSHPETYKVVFDILDEVIDVFEPNYINIGHDELYTVGICDRCKDKDPVDLFVGDITKINDYLRGKGIQSIIWSEKLFQAKMPNGWPVGGSASADGWVPALYECAGKLPKDVLMLNWYWSLCDKSCDDMVFSHGYKMLYGNFSAQGLKDYRKRMDNGILGGIISNWGSLADEYMQRNHQDFKLAFSAAAMWSKEYDSPQMPVLGAKVENELYRRHCVKLGKHRIEIIHKTDMSMKYKVFYDGVFIEDDIYIIGNYRLVYTDGTEVLLPIKYGYNLIDCKVDPDYGNTAMIEPLGASKHLMIGDDVCFKTSYRNPFPEKEIQGIYLEPDKSKNCTITLCSVDFDPTDDFLLDENITTTSSSTKYSDADSMNLIFNISKNN